MMVLHIFHDHLSVNMDVLLLLKSIKNRLIRCLIDKNFSFNNNNTIYVTIYRYLNSLPQSILSKHVYKRYDTWFCKTKQSISTHLVYCTSYSNCSRTFRMSSSSSITYFYVRILTIIDFYRVIIYSTSLLEN